MATIEFIQKRIEGKTKEISKLEKKLERIHKAESTGWKVNPYYYDDNDLKWTIKDLEEAKEALAKWEAELTVANEKAQSRNVEAILKFLERWKRSVTNYYIESFPKYIKARAEYWERSHELGKWYCYKGEERRQREAEYRENRKEFEAAWRFIQPYVIKNRETGTDELDTAKLAKDLENDANAMYDDIIERTNKITGTITDASNLSIGANGELNGYIIGEKGTAKVNTIGAGGYNIQCFHFRTLIHKM